MTSYNRADKATAAHAFTNLTEDTCVICGETLVRPAADSLWKHAKTKSMFCYPNKLSERPKAVER